MTMSSGGQLVADQQLEVLGKSAAAWMLTLVAAQQFHALFCAAHGHNGLMVSLRNAALWAAILVDIALLALFIYSPGLNALFGVVPPPGHTWLFPVAIALVLFVLFQVSTIGNKQIRIFCPFSVAKSVPPQRSDKNISSRNIEVSSESLNALFTQQKRSHQNCLNF